MTMTPPHVPGFELLEVIRENSVSRTWKARQHSLDRMVLIRTPRPEATAAQRSGFDAVARALARIKHPGLVPVIDVATTDEGETYIVQEAVEGPTLAELIADRTQVPPLRSARIGAEIAATLDLLWKQASLVHRNLKPENLCITPEGVVKLIDFSAATLIRHGEDPLAADDGLIVGTPNYMAPEQASGSNSLDYRADMYGLGALLYHLVTGVAPFAYASDPLHVMQLQLSATLPSPRIANPKVTPAFDSVMARLMMKAPEARYDWWQDVTADLQRVAKGLPLHRYPKASPRTASTIAAYQPPGRTGYAPGGASSSQRLGDVRAASARHPHPAPATRLLLWLLLGCGLAALGYYRWHAPPAPPAEPASTHDRPAAEPLAAPQPAQPLAADPQPVPPQPAEAAPAASAQLPADIVAAVTQALTRENKGAAMELLRGASGHVGDAEPARATALRALEQTEPSDDLVGVRLLDNYRGRPVRVTYRNREYTVVPESYAVGYVLLQILEPDGTRRPWSVRVAELTPADRLFMLGVPPEPEVPDPLLDHQVALLALAAGDARLMRRILPRVAALEPFLQHALQAPQ